MKPLNFCVSCAGLAAHTGEAPNTRFPPLRRCASLAPFFFLLASSSSFPGFASTTSEAQVISSQTKCNNRWSANRRQLCRGENPPYSTRRSEFSVGSHDLRDPSALLSLSRTRGAEENQ